VKVGSDVNSKPCELQLVEKNLSNLKINNIILNYLTSLLKGSFKIIWLEEFFSTLFHWLCWNSKIELTDVGYIDCI